MLNMAYQRKLETFETLTTTQNDTVIGGFCCSCSGSVKTALNTLFNDVTLWQHMASIERVIMPNMRHHRKGSGGPVGLSVPSEGEGATHASTHVYMWGKGETYALPQTGFSAHPGELLALGCKGALTPCDAAASITPWLFCCCSCSPHIWIGQAGLTEHCPDRQLGSEQPWPRDDCLPETARLSS